jgi:hypothetical protein
LDNAIDKGVEFVSEKLGQILTGHGFEAVDLVENGFPQRCGLQIGKTRSNTYNTWVSSCGLD